MGQDEVAVSFCFYFVYSSVRNIWFVGGGAFALIIECNMVCCVRNIL